MHRLITILLAVLLSLMLYCHANAATSVTKDAIRWEFDDDYVTGQFITGDWYVVAPYGMQVTSISTSGTDTLGGSMKNPAPNNQQGYDPIHQYTNYANYDSSLNVGLSLPVSLSGGDKLVTTTLYSYYLQIHPDDGAYSQTGIEQAAILTVLSSAPASGSFRPGLCDTSNVIYNESDIDWTLLKNLAPVSGAPTLAYLENKFARPWIDHFKGWPGRDIHPHYNMQDYGGKLVGDTGRAALTVNCNYTQAEKEPIVIGLIQNGLDFYSNIKRDNSFYNSAPAQIVGRKFSVMFAGNMLDIAEIKAIWTKTGSYLHTNWGYYPSDAWLFSEDVTTEYVRSDDVTATEDGADKYISSEYNYTTAMIGMPEWFHQKYSQRGEGTPGWTTDPYRHIYGAVLGDVLATKIMGWSTQWNNQAWFDYWDRWFAINYGNADPDGYVVPLEGPPSVNLSYGGTGWAHSMWNEYADGYTETCADTSSECTNQTDCENADWDWYDDECHPNPEGYPGPVASNVFPTATQVPGTTSGTVSFDSDENSTWRYSTDSSDEWADMTAMSTTGSTTHSQAVTGWTDGNSFSYYFFGQDGDGNESDKLTITVTIGAETDICALSASWWCLTQATCEAITGLTWFDGVCYDIEEPSDWEGENLIDMADIVVGSDPPTTVVVSGDTVTCATNSTGWPPASAQLTFGDGTDDVEYRYVATIEMLTTEGTTEKAEVYTANEGEVYYYSTGTKTGIVTSNSDLSIIGFQAPRDENRTVKWSNIVLKKVKTERGKQIRGVSGSFSTH